jgi:fucose permease
MRLPTLDHDSLNTYRVGTKKMMQVPHRQTRRLYVLFLAGFVVFGALFTIIGAALPQIIRTFHWSYTITGVVLAASAIGYFLSTFICGFLVQRFSPKAVLVTGLMICALSMAFFVRWPSPWLNLALNFAIGLGQGTIEVVTNLEVIHMEKRGQSRLMNLMHAAFSMGAIVGPASVGIVLGMGSRGTIVFSAAAVMLALMALFFGIAKFPRLAQENEHGQREGLRLLRRPILLILTLFLLLYVGAELGVSTWVSEYFVKVLSTTASTGAFAVSLFWIGIFSGRLGASLAYKGTRQEYILLSLTLLAALALGFVLLVSSTVAVAVGVFLAGLGLSALYPLVMAMVGRYFKSGFAVGTAATGGALGSFTFPFLMAVLAESVGMRGGFWFYLGLTGVLVVLSLVIVRVARRTPMPGA